MSLFYQHSKLNVFTTFICIGRVIGVFSCARQIVGNFWTFFWVGGPLPDLDLPPKPQSMNEVKSGSDDANMEE